jgi:hypothetical protein
MTTALIGEKSKIKRIITNNPPPASEIWRTKRG